MKLQRFNLALCPIVNHFAQSTISFARANFGPKAKGYLLGEGALAHVTLAQFKAERRVISAIWEKLCKYLPKRTNLNFSGLFLRNGTSEHSGYVWSELTVGRTAELIEMQKAAVKEIESFGVKVFTACGEQYLPHLTLARLPSNTFPLNLKYPDKKVFLKAHSFKPTIGLSDENGVYLKVLKEFRNE